MPSGSSKTIPSIDDDICPICGDAVAVGRCSWALNANGKRCHYTCLHPVSRSSDTSHGPRASQVSASDVIDGATELTSQDSHHQPGAGARSSPYVFRRYQQGQRGYCEVCGDKVQLLDRGWFGNSQCGKCSSVKSCVDRLRQRDDAELKHVWWTANDREGVGGRAVRQIAKDRGMTLIDRPRFRTASLVDMLISLVLPGWGVVVGAVASSKGEQRRGQTMIWFGIICIIMVVIFKIIWPAVTETRARPNLSPRYSLHA